MHSTNSDTSDTSFQVDVFVSFFVILLIAAMVVINNLTTPASNLPHMEYRSEDKSTVPFVLRGWHPIFAFNSLWIAHSGHLIRLNTVALALAMAGGHPLFSSKNADDFSAPLTDSRDLGDFILDIRIRNVVPPELIAEDLPLDTPNLTELFVQRMHSNALAAPMFYVWPDQLQHITRLFSALRQRGLVFRWLQINLTASGTGVIKLKREASRYTLESILR